MKQRTITGVFILAIFLPLLLVDDLFPIFQGMMIVLTGIAANEMLRMYDTQKKMSITMRGITIFCSILLYLAALVEWIPRSIPAQGLALFNIHLEMLPTIILITIILFTCTVFSESYDGTDVGKSITTILYTGIGFAAITILKYLGMRYIVFLFLITTLTDVFAYLTGMLFGKHKMAPKISPKKTWEGAIGGTIVATILGSVFALLYGVMFGNFFGPAKETLLTGICNTENLTMIGISIILVLITFFTSIIGQIGDLVASRLKRTYDIKDFGNIFPGHGGVLDRLDSALLASLFLLSVFKILNYLLPLVETTLLGI